jgi:vesicle-fusing ATPase
LHLPNKARPSLVVAESTRWLAEQTRNFSGAELEGLVRAAASSAINTTISLAEAESGADSSAGTGGLPSAQALDNAAAHMSVTRADFERALEDIKPALGIDEDVLAQLLDGTDLPLDQSDATATFHALVAQVRDGTGSSTASPTLLFTGASGTGMKKTLTLAHLTFLLDPLCPPISLFD